MSYGHSNHIHSHHCLLLSYYRGAAAKRPERRHRCRFRRHGKSDGFWATRRSHGAVPSNDLVRDYLHGDFNYSLRDRFPSRRTKVGASRTEPITNQITTGEAGRAAHRATASATTKMSAGRSSRLVRQKPWTPALYDPRNSSRWPLAVQLLDSWR